MVQAVCVDGVYLGEKVESYMGEPARAVGKYALVFQTAETSEVDEHGNAVGEPQRFEVSVEFTASMGSKAALRKFAGDWRGKAFGDDEANTFDVTKFVGANALLNIEHKTSAKGKTYAKIRSAAPLMKGMPKIKAEGYTRADFWGRRKDEYLADLLAFRGTPIPPSMAAPAQRPAPAKVLVSAMADLPAALQDEDDDLPF
jgi:hypothetical protein